MATTLVNGVELYYDVVGSGDCVVLTHGSWTDATGWQGAATLLARRYRVVTWDRRGHSRSQPGGGRGSRAQRSMQELAATVVHELSHRLGNTGDPAYCSDPPQCNLPTKKALDNADSYAQYARTIFNTSM